MITDEDVKKLVSEFKKIFATKEDLKSFVTKDDLRKFATKDDLKGIATKDDLKSFATKDDLKSFATKKDLKTLATKDDLKEFATKDDLLDLKEEIRKVDKKLDAIYANLAENIGILMKDVREIKDIKTEIRSNRVINADFEARIGYLEEKIGRDEVKEFKERIQKYKIKHKIK